MLAYENQLHSGSSQMPAHTVRPRFCVVEDLIEAVRRPSADAVIRGHEFVEMLFTARAFDEVGLASRA